ncbi:MAG TPA: PH domain-containing protein [Mycobacteriales bacterium]|nr:PH domain-containing protein [Mycobacteriales bacterium]
MELRPPRHRVSPRAIRYWAVRALPGWLVLVAAQVLWWVVSSDLLTWHIAGLAVTGALAALHLTVMPRWRYRVHRWEITDEAVYTQVGWFSQEWRIAPLSRIQTVDTKRGPIETVFGLANVTITTASAAGPLTLEGLERSVALEVSDLLTARTHALAADAT